MLTMEIMEDGNLVDRVRILLQRDMEYYQEKQTVLREPICIRVSGGKLDFPRHASFAAIKIVTWWEADFVTAFKQASGLSLTGNGSIAKIESEDGVIKQIQPSEFILLVVDTAKQLLEHLHTLIQESLDHADLTVLTATLGAAALVRNCLWCYNQQAKNVVAADPSDKINKSYKSYHEMAEAVAERLLDLHCRLISLYILHEADSLSWHSNKSFFEKERCSYVIQMWWLYMQGTKADLWNSVSPKMAQRIYSGMLNESLSILTTRFIHGRPSLARSEQFWTDAYNVLCCTAYLALSACVGSNEMIGTHWVRLPTAIRDIHTKCHELLVCLLLRGTPLKELYQAFRNGLEKLMIIQPRRGPAAWLLICAPNLVGSTKSDINIQTLPCEREIILEINILRHQPQPNWPQLMKVVSMADYVVAKMLLRVLVRHCIGLTTKQDTTNENPAKTTANDRNCSGFLCSGTVCEPSMKITSVLGLFALTYVLAITAREPELVILSALKEDPDWATYLDRQQVWNQTRPPWLNALLMPFQPMMHPIIKTLLDAVQTGASIYQAMSLAIGCFTELHTTVPVAVLRTTFVLDDNIPAHCHPIGSSILLQILCTSLYSALLVESENVRETLITTLSSPENCETSSFNPYDKSAAAIVLAEAICSIDEDNKHTAQIDFFLSHVKQSIDSEHQCLNQTGLDKLYSLMETYVDDLLFTSIGRRSLKIVHEYIIRASDWVLNNLRPEEKVVEAQLINLPVSSPTMKPLTHTMFHIEDVAFDQFLSNYDGTNWRKVLSLPLSVTLKRLRSQLFLRPEFKNVGEISLELKDIVCMIKRLCSSTRTARFE